MTPADVDRILGRVRSGDTDAYEQLVRRCQSEVWRVVAGVLHDIRETEDLVQQTFVNAYFHLDRVVFLEYFVPMVVAPFFG